MATAATVMGELSDRALGRALLTRQGLLERMRRPVTEAVEAIGAIQAQHWPAVPVALWSRVAGFDPAELAAALADQRLVAGTLLRRTLHVASAADHPVYAAVTEDPAAPSWRRTPAPETAAMAAVRRDLHDFVGPGPRTDQEIAAFIEERIAAAGPGVVDPAELAKQRSVGWKPMRTTPLFLRVPADGRWGARTPGAFAAAPSPPWSPDAPDRDEALDAAVRRHLRAFGPASAEDAATWLGVRVPAARAALGRLEPGLARFTDPRGRPLYDEPDAPRPDPDTPAPVRFLPWFDSALLAYDAKRRSRILPDAYRDVVYSRANLRINPTFLVDGLVAGLWSVRKKARAATVTVTPFERLPAAAKAEVVAEAERLVRFLHPDARSPAVTVES